MKNIIKLTQFVIDNFINDVKKNINIFNYNTQDGTAYTIDYIYRNHLVNYKIKNLLITWCDILPKENINMHFHNICLFLEIIHYL